jgi:hypothetical protein
MAQRNELNVRAAAVGLDGTTIPNDSKLEQKVLWLEKNSYAVTGTAPTTTLTTSGVFSDGETLTLGSVVYTFKTALTAATTANQVLIGAAATNTLDNLKDAINCSSSVTTPGVGYGSLTVRHPQLTAGTKTASTLVITSTDTNAAGLIATTETCANAALTGSTLTGGVLGSVAQLTSTNSGVAGLSGDRNTSL